MALTSDQIANILFKKVITGKSTTDTNKQFFEESKSGRPFVDLSQIWTQSDKIPQTAAPVTGVVQHVVDLQLNNVAGTSASFDHPSLTNVIPFNYGDGSSYLYQIKTQAGVNVPLSSNSLVLDTETGTLTFFEGLPSGVNASTPPKISFYKYIGATAATAGLGGGSGSVSMGEWQDSVKGFTAVVPASPAHGDRHIVNIAAGLTANIYNTANDVVASGNIPDMSIITYKVNATLGKQGWVVTAPSMGMFTSVDSSVYGTDTLENVVHFYNTTNGWTKYETEKTYPTEKEMASQKTEVVLSNLPHVASNDQIAITGTPSTDVSVFVNGIKLKDAQYMIATLSVEPLETATLAKFDSSGTIVWKAVSGGVVFGDAPAGSVTYYKHVVSAFPKTGDYLMVKPTLGYDLDGGSDADEITVNYVRPTA